MQPDLKELIQDDMVLMDGHDDCICGIVSRFGQPPIVCYDLEKVIAQLVEDGMSEDEAYEFHEFNQLGAWVGDTTPCFLQKFSEQNLS